MKKIDVYKLNSLYRDDMRITGYQFGEGEPTLCVVGSMRGNEVQQLYMCGQLIQKLQKIEQEGKLIPGKKILIIPCLNSYSMNIGKRFWPTDNTDINRMFPGYALGETTQRIAAGVFQTIKDYKYGIQFASFYMPGCFLPHIRIMKTGYEDLEVAKKFGFPYVSLRNPRPFDTATLNYNWQIWEAKAYSIYTTTTEQVDKDSASKAVDGIIQMMQLEDIIQNDEIHGTQLHEEAFHENHNHFSRILEDKDYANVRCQKAGIYFTKVSVGDKVKKGQLIAQIVDAMEGTMIEELWAPCDGTVFFQHNAPMTLAHTAVIKLIKETV